MTKVISVRLNEDLLKKVEIISRRLKRSKNWVIGEVLENDHEQAKKELLSD